MRIYLTFILLGLTFMFGCGGGFQAGDADLVFRFAMQPIPENKAWEAGNLVKQEIERRSNGKIKIMFYDSARLGAERQILEALYLGLVEMAQVTSSVVTTLDPKFNTLDMPYIFVDEAHHQKILNGEVGLELLNGLRKNNLQGLSFYSCGFRHVYANKPVRSPDDLKGMKIRVMESPVMLASINAMGATATPLAATEVFTSLKTGVVDGAENNPQVFVAAKHIEGVKHLSLTGHFANQHVLLVNRKWFDALKPEYRELIRTVSRDVIPEYNRRWNEAVDQAMKDILRQNGTITHLEKDVIIEFMQKVESVYGLNTDTVPLELVNRIRKEAGL